MSIDEQIEAAWGEYRSKQHFRTLEEECAAEKAFDEGYLAVLRKFCQEIEPSEMVVGRYYWVGGMIGIMQGFKLITAKSGIAVKWPIVNGEAVCPDLFSIRGPIPNGSDLPSPSEVFGEEG